MYVPTKTKTKRHVNQRKNATDVAPIMIMGNAQHLVKSVLMWITIPLQKYYKTKNNMLWMNQTVHICLKRMAVLNYSQTVYKCTVYMETVCYNSL